MHKIGLISIGQSPRKDIVAVMRHHLTQEVEILQRGALDGLDLSTVAELRPEAGQSTLVTRMRDGTQVHVAREKILPLMQKGIDALENEGVELIVLLCTGEFPELQAEKMVLCPGQILHGVIVALAGRTRLGVIVPSANQLSWAKERWAELDIVVTSASPYSEPSIRASEWKRAAEELQACDVDLVYLDCMGMDEEMKRIVQQETRKPVILASSVVARIIDELSG
jgi:protein AroM